MIVFCSVNGKSRHIYTVYCTSMKPMAGLPLIECLCRTKELVYGYKYEGKSDEWYINGYRQSFASRWVDVKAWLDSLQVDVDATYVCYCKEGKFCHRKLMAMMLAKHRPDIEVVLH